MEKTALAAVILRMMNAVQPEAPWKGTYQASAEAFAEVALDTPLFSGESGPMRTAALFVSLSWFEGNFKQDAQGDCLKKDEKGRCVSDPQSLCTFQVGVTHLAKLGTSKEEILADIKVCTKSARSLLATSMRVCARRPQLEWLGWYAAGGEDCEKGLEKSRHRMQKAAWLFDHYPTQP